MLVIPATIAGSTFIKSTFILTNFEEKKQATHGSSTRIGGRNSGQLYNVRK